MKLIDAMGAGEIEYLRKNDMIGDEHVAAEADESFTVPGSHGEGSATYLLFDSVPGHADLIVAAYPQVEPSSWIPGEGGPTWDDLKTEELGDDE